MNVWRESFRVRASEMGPDARLRLPALFDLFQEAAGNNAAALGWGSDVRLTNDPGASMTTYNFAHDVAVGADHAVHVVWYDDRDGTAQVYYKRSLDGGTSWEADRRLIADTSATRLNPAVAASGETVYASWHEVRTDGGYYVAVARSIDGGTTWDPPITLTTTKASAFTSIAADGASAQIVWGDTATGATEIWQSSSHDGGQHWTAPVQISSSPYHSWVPNVAQQGDRVITNFVGQPIVRRTPAAPVGNRRRSAVAITAQKPISLPWRDVH